MRTVPRKQVEEIVARYIWRKWFLPEEPNVTMLDSGSIVIVEELDKEIETNIEKNLSVKKRAHKSILHGILNYKRFANEDIRNTIDSEEETKIFDSIANCLEDEDIEIVDSFGYEMAKNHIGEQNKKIKILVETISALLGAIPSDEKDNNEKIKAGDIVEFDYKNMPEENHKDYIEIFPKGEKFVFLKELNQMPEHGVFLSLKTSAINTGFHIENFILVDESEL